MVRRWEVEAGGWRADWREVGEDGWLASAFSQPLPGQILSCSQGSAHLSALSLPTDLALPLPSPWLSMSLNQPRLFPPQGLCTTFPFHLEFLLGFQMGGSFVSL